MKKFTETERKFILKKLPDFVNSRPMLYERHYLYSHDGIEIRVQVKDGDYELERKVATSKLGRDTHTMEITQGEFEMFKMFSRGAIVRESYLIGDERYDISIKVYHGKHEGLIRAEVEFNSEEEASRFEPYDWMGNEITDSPIGRDSSLLKLTEEEFKKLLSDSSQDPK